VRVTTVRQLPDRRVSRVSPDRLRTATAWQAERGRLQQKSAAITGIRLESWPSKLSRVWIAIVGTRWWRRYPVAGLQYFAPL